MQARAKLMSFVSTAVLAFGSAAQADVTVFVDVDKTFTKTVTETVTIDKDIDLFVEEFIEVDAVSEQEVFKNQRNQYNYVQEEDSTSSATIDTGTGNGASGVVLINQAPGFINNQGNEVSVTFANSPLAEDSSGVFAHANVSVEQINGYEPPNEEGQPVGQPPDFDLDGFPDPVNVYSTVSGTGPSTDTIADSFNDGAGVVGVNQAAGSLNNQNNAIAIALGDDTVFALGQAELGQFNTWNFANVSFHDRFDTISGSFAGWNGVVAVNQSAGAINNQANVVDIAVGVNGFPTPVPGL